MSDTPMSEERFDELRNDANVFTSDKIALTPTCKILASELGESLDEIHRLREDEIRSLQALVNELGEWVLEDYRATVAELERHGCTDGHLDDVRKLLIRAGKLKEEDVV